MRLSPTRSRMFDTELYQQALGWPPRGRLACIGNPDPRDVKVVVGGLQLGLRSRLGSQLGRRGDGEPMTPPPFRVMPRRATHALSGACSARVVGVAEGGPACLGSADWPRPCSLASGTPSASVEASFPGVYAAAVAA